MKLKYMNKNLPSWCRENLLHQSGFWQELEGRVRLGICGEFHQANLDKGLGRVWGSQGGALQYSGAGDSVEPLPPPGLKRGEGLLWRPPRGRLKGSAPNRNADPEEGGSHRELGRAGTGPHTLCPLFLPSLCLLLGAATGPSPIAVRPGSPITQSARFSLLKQRAGWEKVARLAGNIPKVS